MSWAEEEVSLRQAGFNDQEIADERGHQRFEMMEAGFAGNEIDDYFGIKNPDMTPMKNYFEENLKQLTNLTPTPSPMGEMNEPGTVEMPGPKKASTFLEAMDAGWQMSVSGLVARGKNPDVVLPEDAGAASRIASMATSLAGDFPAMVLGGAIGAPVGGSVGTIGGGLAGAPVAGVGAIPGAAVGGAVGLAVGAAGGANALPAAVRKILMDHYEKGDIQDFSDFWERASGTFYDSAKAFTVGAAGSVGGVVGGKLAGPFIGTTAEKMSSVGGEIAAMTYVGKALEGEVPKSSDFLDAGILLLGIKGATKLPPMAGRLATKFRTIYGETGVRPEAVVEEAMANPAVMGELMSNGPGVPKIFESVDAVKPTEIPAEMPSKSILKNEVGAFGDVGALRIEKIPTAPEPVAKKPEVVSSVEEQAVLERIAPSAEKTKSGLTFDEVYRQTIDDLHPLNVYTKLVGGDAVPAKESPYIMARLSKGGMGRGDRFIDFGPVEFESMASTGGKGLRQILEPHQENLDGLRAYLVSKRAIEKAGQGIETGIPLAEAQKVVAAGSKKYQTTMDEIQGYRDASIKYMEDSGVLSREASAAFKELNKDYVPFYRLVEEQPKGMQTKGFSVQSPFRKMTGSDAKIIDPIESLIKDTYSFVQVAERNRVLKNVVELAEKNPEAAKGLIEKVPTKQSAIEVRSEDMQRFLKENGIDADLENTMTIFKPDKTVLAKDEVSYFKDGKREVYKVHPAMAEALKSLDGDSTNFIIKMLNKPAGLLRVGTTLAPDFISRNYFRDQLSAFVNSSNNFVPVFDSLRGLGSLLRKDNTYQEWLSAGGSNSAAINLDRSYIQENIFRLSQETGLMSKTWNVVKSPLHALTVMSELLENSTRLGEFQRAREKGKDPFAAAYDAREVTLDFARSGAKTRAVNSIIAFWNASLQGKDRTIRAFKDDPTGTAIRLTASVTVPSVMLWWANKDDPRWSDIPNWQKDMSWIVMTDKWEEAAPGQELPPDAYTKVVDGKTMINNGTVYRLPKPQDTGVMFGSLAERTLEAFFAKNPKALKDFDLSMRQLIDMEYIPTGAAPVLEHITNKSFFTGNPVVSGPLEKLSPEYRYTEYTTETAKGLGKLIQTVPGMQDSSVASPVIIENYVRGWTGTMGMYAMQAVDKSLQKSGIIPDPIRPTATLADIPFVRAFVVRHPSASAQSIQDFREKFKENEMKFNDIKFNAKNGDLRALEIELNTDPEKMMQLSGMNDAIGVQTKMIRDVYKDESMTADEKRQIIDGIYYQMIEITKLGNQMVSEFEKSIKQ